MFDPINAFSAFTGGLADTDGSADEFPAGAMYYEDELQYQDPRQAALGAMLFSIGQPAGQRDPNLILRAVQSAHAHNTRVKRMMTPRYQLAGDRLIKFAPDGRPLGFENLVDPETEPAFAGTGMEAQALNIHLDPSIPDDDPRKQLARQRLSQMRTVTTPEGTYTLPGYDLGGGSAGGGGMPVFTPKPPTEGEKRGEYTVDSLQQLDSQATGYVPTTTEALTSEYLPDSVSGHLQSGEYKQYRATADEWARTLVFMRSGATARQEEVDASFRNYWPQPGDDEAEVARKAQARQAAMQSAQKAYTGQSSQSSVRPGDKYLTE